MTYGSLNMVLEEMLNMMFESDDLANLMLSKSNEDVIGLPPPHYKDRMSLISGKEQQIFKYRRIPDYTKDGIYNCYISMEYGAVSRETRRGTNTYFKNIQMIIRIFVPIELEETYNGSRTMCIDKCLEDTLSGEMIDSISKCYVASSIAIERPPEGYIGRKMLFIFADVNEGMING